MPMHPDAAAVYHPFWEVNAPNINHKGRSKLFIGSRFIHKEPTAADNDAADRLAALLIDSPVLSTAGYGVNGGAVRVYHGGALTRKWTATGRSGVGGEMMPSNADR